MFLPAPVGTAMAGTITVRTITVRRALTKQSLIRRDLAGRGAGNPARFCAEALSFCHIQSVADDLVF
jgi:hypothetical protein